MLSTYTASADDGECHMLHCEYVSGLCVARVEPRSSGGAIDDRARCNRWKVSLILCSSLMQERQDGEGPHIIAGACRLDFPCDHAFESFLGDGIRVRRSMITLTFAYHIRPFA